jgi:hypothetical protein
MKIQHLTTLAAALLIAGVASAQTITYKDAATPLAAKVSAALAKIAAPDATGPETEEAVSFLFDQEDVYALSLAAKAAKAASPGLVDAAIADPTFGGRVDKPDVRGRALLIQGVALTTAEAKAAFFAQAVARTDLPAASRGLVKAAYKTWVLQAALRSERAGDTAAAESRLAAAVPVIPAAALGRLAELKIVNGSADALVTALRAWQVAPFYEKAAATQTVASALEIEPGQGVDAGKAFIQWVKTGTGTNPVAGIKIPKLVVEGGADADEVARLILAGQQADALIVARRALAKAKNQNDRNKAGELVLGVLSDAKWTTAVEADAKAIFGANWTFATPTPAPAK